MPESPRPCRSNTKSQVRNLPALETNLPSRSLEESGFEESFADRGPHPDLKGRTIRGGAVTVSSQFAQFFLYTASTVVLARLLSPEDFGLVGMVMAVTGFLRIFKDAGLSTATVQREVITRELVSTVFWINMVLGAAITLVSVALAPALAAFYREPRLFWVTLAFAGMFMLDAAAAQHQALLRRQMRFKALALIDISSMTIGLGVSLAMALTGFGYWALVGMPVASGVATVLAVWIAEPWRPGWPKRGCGAGSMMRFGGFLTAVNLLNYLFRNADNVLVGWYWGAGALGFYQKAYGLLMLPISQVNSPISGVAVSTLSRIQSDPERQKRFFLGGYSIAVSITLPIVVAATIFADDIIQLVLGPKWLPAVSIFRMLAPAALIGALLNPFGWLFISSGRADRQFMAGLIWSPLIVVSFGAGLKYGPEGVAIGYSIMSAMLALPLCCYAVKGTRVRLKDLARALKWPMLAVTVTGAIGALLKINISDSIPVGVRAIGGCAVVVGSYAFILLVLMRQWKSYQDLVRHLLPSKKSSNRSELP